MASISTVQFKFPLGQDNITPETQLQDGSARSLINIDPYPSGEVRTRAGLRLIASGNFHSLYQPSHKKFSLCWKDGNLCRINGNTVTSLQNLSSRIINYADLNGETFWTNGETAGRVKLDGTSSFWGLPLPPSPEVTVIMSGGLHAGTYQIAMTAVVDGIESGSNTPTVVQVAKGGGVEVSVPTGATFNIYMTPSNGTSSELRYVATAQSGAISKIGTGTLGRHLRGLLAHRPRPGQAMASYQGRLFVASGSFVWFTEAMAPHLLLPEFGYFKFDSAVLMIGVSENGLYIGTRDSIRFLAGNSPEQMSVRFVSSVGSASSAISLSPVSFTDNGPVLGRQCAWVSSDGYLCVGKPDGIISRPHHSRFCMGKLSGVTLSEIERGGLRQVIVGIGGSELGQIPVNDATVAETFTHGLILGEA